MKTISSYPLFGSQLKAEKPIAITSQRVGDSSLFATIPVSDYITSPLVLLTLILGVGGLLASTLSSAIKEEAETTCLSLLFLK